jgi:hypothetical protein
VRVESQLLGDFQVFGQNGGANKLGHTQDFPRPMAVLHFSSTMY